MSWLLAYVIPRYLLMCDKSCSMQWQISKSVCFSLRVTPAMIIITLVASLVVCIYSIYCSPTQLVQQQKHKKIVPATSPNSTMLKAIMAIIFSLENSTHIYCYRYPHSIYKFQWTLNVLPFSHQNFTVMILPKDLPFLSLGIGTQRAWQLAVSCVHSI